MRIVIIGSGIAGTYIANKLKEKDRTLNISLLSDEIYPPYDRIHLCRLVDSSENVNGISIALNPTVRLELNQKIINIDREKKRIFTKDSMFSYDKLIIATGSLPLTLFDIQNISNAAVCRSADDTKRIREGVNKREVVIVGSGPIALELLETLNAMAIVKHITVLVRGKYLYSKDISRDAIKTIEQAYMSNDKVCISYEDEIVEKEVKNSQITLLKTKKIEIENPFLIFGVGIKPNIEPFREILKSKRGLLTNTYMQTEDENIYAIGECAEVETLNFVAGHVKACTLQADCAISHILGIELEEFKREIDIDMLKVGTFDLIEISSTYFTPEYEKVLMSAKAENRIDEYFFNDERLSRFIGINSNVDVAYLANLMKSGKKVDINYLYENRLIGKRGRLVCSCEHTYTQDIVDIVRESGIASFSELCEYTQAGRTCGKCKIMVQDIIKGSQHLIDPNHVRKSAQEIQREQEIHRVKKRIEKFNRLNPYNKLTSDNLECALESLDIEKNKVNSWVSMVTANMQLHPNFESLVEQGVKTLNKIPIIWLELADCSGNSEAFIKSANPSIEELIFDYISLDYHELLMSASGDQSESILEEIIKKEKGKYILIVEGAVPLAMDGKFLRIGASGETGIDLLQRSAKDAALIIAVGSCAFDGGIVAAKPNPTGAVGVGEALQRDDIINIPGCPTNPTNIIGTLLSYLMFEELPALDKFNRPLWAYEGRIHDNCERRGHFELGEFVKEWGDEGAKKGYCLFEMGCKGPYANANCPTMKFNAATSWPVQAGHGCMGCVEAGFIDKFADERKYNKEDKDEL